MCVCDLPTIYFVCIQLKSYHEENYIGSRIMVVGMGKLLLVAAAAATTLVTVVRDFR